MGQKILRPDLFLFTVIYLLFLSDHAWTRPADHVILISIDGLRPEFYKDQNWPAPAMQQMAAEGAYCDGVHSIFPSVTYPAHTTIITGALPARHGIYYNSPFEPEGQSGRWYWEADSIRVPAIWQAVRETQLTSAAISWPVTVNAPIDYNIPEIWSIKKGEDPLAPMRKFSTPPGLFEELERNAAGPLNAQVYGLDYLTREDRSAAMAGYLIETYRPNLMAVHLVGTDHFQHEEGRDGPMVRRAVSAVDRAVAAITEAADRAGILDRTAVIITGDHGFVDIHTRIAANRWLIEDGLMEAGNDRNDWRATFYTSGVPAFLFLKDRNDKETLRRVRMILDRLDPALKRLFRVVERPELDRIGADPRIPLALNPVPGVRFTGSVSADILSAADGGSHGYYPDIDDIHTGFIAWGAGVRSAVVIPQMGLQDIAPLIAKILDLEFKAPDGVVYPGILVGEE